MFKLIAKYLFGTVNDRHLKKFSKYVSAVNAYEPSIMQLSDEALSGQTDKFKLQLTQGASLDDLLPEAFATVREVSRRVLGMRHFDVQIIGGIALHKGMIAEMATGEGKTLVAPLAAYLNALTGKGVHIVTVNDYLVKRDYDWVGKIFTFLGMSIGSIYHGISDQDRQAAYNADITFSTNNELGFDYLRDNMKYHHDHIVQRKYNFAIVDEIDSILIDEARTPLIISGPTEGDTSLYYKIDQLIRKLDILDYEKDEKTKTIVLSDSGTTKIEHMLQEANLINKSSSMYDLENLSIVHHVNQSLKAHKMFHKDIDYMIKDGAVLIIDEFTGRAMEGRRYSDGLHQAIEAKEAVQIHNENQTLASITYQNYFRMYPKLSGMSGSAMTEAHEFYDIYKLEVLQVPTNKKVTRVDEEDEIYATNDEKFQAILKEIIHAHKKQQPLLIGTVSIEKSEHLSSLLKKHKIKHNVLNAKFHEQEAMIISQAGKPGAVTIATNMAGRGTDIKLGGNLEYMLKSSDEQDQDSAKITAQYEKDRQVVLEAGGLYVIATERHESRRIDNQLRGRSGRQGDPGRSKFYLSLEDDLMRIFASERVGAILKKLGLKEGEAIYHPMVSKALERAQKKVEGFNYEMRKNLLKFDDVSNEQRKVVYEQRREILQLDDVRHIVDEVMDEVNENIICNYLETKQLADEEILQSLETEFNRIYGIDFDLVELARDKNLYANEIKDHVSKISTSFFNEKVERYSPDIYKAAEKRCMLLTLDQEWKDHLHFLDTLKHGINLRAYGQKDPLNEYKREAFVSFDKMLTNYHELLIHRLAFTHLTMVESDEGNFIAGSLVDPKTIRESRIDPGFVEQGQYIAQENSGTVINHVAPENRITDDPSSWGKVSRNESCPCGSGNKYKYCHGKLS
jgi:preprotein translocase subunit SecA